MLWRVLSADWAWHLPQDCIQCETITKTQTRWTGERPNRQQQRIHANPYYERKTNAGRSSAVMNPNPRQLAFEALVRQLSPELYRFAYWLCKSRALAQDILQECYLRAWRSLEDLRDVSSAKAWMMTILRREFLRTFERKRFDLTDLDDVSIADTVSPSLETQSESNLLRQMIGKLEAKYRVPLVLQILGGLSGTEISAELGMPEATVNTHLFRAREQLKAMVDAPASENTIDKTTQHSNTVNIGAAREQRRI